ncbi:MAG TPA: hypothetical protein PK675_05375 [Clostridia bacterium]|nr:hypothetical protein [Clostridia bacterium]
MKEIINMAAVTFRYTTGTQSVTKSIGAQNVLVIHPLHPDVPLLHLVTTTACARCCQPFWLAAAVEGVSDKPLRFVFSADFNTEFTPLTEIFVNGVPIVGDVRRGVSLCVGVGQTLHIVYGAVFPCTNTFCGICNLPCKKITALARICYLPYFAENSPKYVYSNPVSFKVL